MLVSMLILLDYLTIKHVEFFWTNCDTLSKPMPVLNSHKCRRKYHVDRSRLLFSTNRRNVSHIEPLSSARRRRQCVERSRRVHNSIHFGLDREPTSVRVMKEIERLS